MRYSLLETFEIGGRWWLPERPTRVVSGTLRSSPNERVLILTGSFDDPEPAALGVVADDFDRYSRILGILDNGQRCTVWRAFVTGCQGNLRETTRLECSINTLLIGCHAPDADKMMVDSMTFGSTYLDSFLDPSVFQVQQHRSETVFQGLTVRYSVPPPVIFRVAAISADLEIEIPVSWTEGHTQIIVTAEPCITIRPDHPKDAEWYIKAIWRFLYLLTLLTNESVRPTCLRFTCDDDATNGWLLNRAARPYQSSDTSSGLLLLYFAHLHERFAPICEQWFSADDILVESIHLFMDAVREPDTSLEGRFLTLSQALEAFSRATTSSEYMATEDYEKVASAIIGFIPAIVGPDHRASLKNRIKYGNEFSLRKRLTLLLDSLTPDAVSCVCRSPKNFVAGIVDTRNYLTHYTNELRPRSLRGAALLWTCEKMLMLLRVLLLRQLGIDESLIVGRIREHPRLMQYIHLQQKHVECVEG